MFLECFVLIVSATVQFEEPSIHERLKASAGEFDGQFIGEPIKASPLSSKLTQFKD